MIILDGCLLSESFNKILINLCIGILTRLYSSYLGNLTSRDSNCQEKSISRESLDDAYSFIGAISFSI